MKGTTRFDEREFQATEPLPTSAVVIVIPDSLDHPALDGLIPSPTRPAPLAVPEPAEVEVPSTAPVVAPVVAPEPAVATGDPWDTRMRWTGSDYLWVGLRTVQAALVIGIVWTVVVGVISVVTGIAGAVSLVWAGAAAAGPVLGGVVLVGGLVLLAARASKGTTSGATSGKGVEVLDQTPRPGEPVVKIPRPVRKSEPAARGVFGRLFIGDDQHHAAPAGSGDLTDRWLTRMRDKTSGQSIGRWHGVATDPDSSTFEQDIHDDSKCAVSWLLQEADPTGWNPKDTRGTKHGSWSAVNAKYGTKMISRVMQMNDDGVRLPRIAAYVAKKTGR